MASKMLSIIERQVLAETADQATPVGPGLLAAAALQAGHRPAAALLPFLTGAYSLTVVAALAEVMATRADVHLHRALQLCSHGIVGALRVATQVLQDTTELVLIIFAAW